LFKGVMCNKSWGLFSAGKHVWQHIWGYGLTNITSTFIVFFRIIHSGWLRDGCLHLDEFIRWNIMIGVWWTWLDGFWCLKILYKFGSTWNGVFVSVLTCMWHWLDTTGHTHTMDICWNNGVCHTCSKMKPSQYNIPRKGRLHYGTL